MFGKLKGLLSRESAGEAAYRLHKEWLLTFKRAASKIHPGDWELPSMLSLSPVFVNRYSDGEVSEAGVQFLSNVRGPLMFGSVGEIYRKGVEVLKKELPQYDWTEVSDLHGERVEGFYRDDKFEQDVTLSFGVFGGNLLHLFLKVESGELTQAFSTNNPETAVREARNYLGRHEKKRDRRTGNATQYKGFLRSPETVTEEEFVALQPYLVLAGETHRKNREVFLRAVRKYLLDWESRGGGELKLLLWLEQLKVSTQEEQIRSLSLYKFSGGSGDRSQSPVSSEVVAVQLLFSVEVMSADSSEALPSDDAMLSVREVVGEGRDDVDVYDSGSSSSVAMFEDAVDGSEHSVLVRGFNYGVEVKFLVSDVTLAVWLSKDLSALAAMNGTKYMESAVIESVRVNDIEDYPRWEDRGTAR